MIVLPAATYGLCMTAAYVIGFVCGVMFVPHLMNGKRRDRKEEERERKRKWDKVKRWDDNE